MGRKILANRERATHHSKHLRRKHRRVRRKAYADDSGDERRIWDSVEIKNSYAVNKEKGGFALSIFSEGANLALLAKNSHRNVNLMLTS